QTPSEEHVPMSPQHMSDDLCLDYLTGELPVDERQSFEDHLGECSLCRQSVNEYRTILRSGVLLVADEAVDDLTLDSVPWSIEEGEKRLYAAIEPQDGTRSPVENGRDETRPLQGKTSGARRENFLLLANRRVHVAALASL